MPTPPRTRTPSTPTPADTPVVTPSGSPPSRLMRAFSTLLSPFLGPAPSSLSAPTPPNERNRTVSDAGDGKSRRLSRVNWNGWRSVVSLNTFEERDPDSGRAERMEKEAKERNKADIVAQRQLALPRLGPDLTLALAGPAAAATLGVEKPQLRRKLSWRKPKEPSTSASASTPSLMSTSTVSPTKSPSSTSTSTLTTPKSSPPMPPTSSSRPMSPDARPMSPPMSPPPCSRPMSPESSRPMSPIASRAMSPPPGRPSLAISAPRALLKKQPSITISPAEDTPPPKRIPPVPPRIQLSDFGFVRDGPPTPPPRTSEDDAEADMVPKIELSLIDTALDFDFGFGNVRAGADEDHLNMKEVKAVRRRSLTVG